MRRGPCDSKLAVTALPWGRRSGNTSSRARLVGGSASLPLLADAMAPNRAKGGTGHDAELAGTMQVPLTDERMLP